ncbi:Hypothetical protein R9X50_00189800 [Acrodontium crateriforme]|uniref:D-xylose 1-dehydrogenase (NADP(+), D-xylono-1,5-lactone-forming) n=1 Tax=Acrodontium crateriforme TaxID=150365 RepID=A0AAQ3M1I8_9PEZI|nr:Hypothetical protein R9X50_00189800 [Acrodontium crateriforme]
MSKFQVKWGILGPGGIAQTFARDLWVDPCTRGVNDIEHVVVAAASSSSASRAADFLKEVRAPEAKAYGSYKELVADPNVDIIYVATPHSHHYQHAMLCLEAGKNVLCEKAFTTNAKQTELLIKKAKEKNLFLMEAVWTRYFPLSIYAREIVTSGRIGPVQRTFADLSFPDLPENFDDSHRMVNPDLAGGALLDLGIYALTWVFQTLYTTQKDPQPPTVVSSLRKYEKLGSDQLTSMLLTFPRKDLGDAHGIATTSLRISSDPDSKGTAGPSIRIQGETGELQIFGPAFRPTNTRLILNNGTVETKNWFIPGAPESTGWKNGFGGNWQAPGEGQGMFYEADECAYALRDGRKEGRFESLSESLVIMQIMDEVRRQGGMTYPEKIESIEFPLDL